MNQIMFAYILGLDPSATRSVIDNLKNTRSILKHRIVGAPSASKVNGTVGSAGPAYTATLALYDFVQSASDPAPGFAVFQALVLTATTFQSTPSPAQTAVAAQET